MAESSSERVTRADAARKSVAAAHALVVADRDPALEPPAKDLLPANEELDPNRDPPLVDPIEELPKCEPSMFDTPRFGEIELRAADVPVIPPRLDPDMLDDPPKFPACEFDATEGAFEPPADPCDAPATEELPVFAPACVPDHVASVTASVSRAVASRAARAVARAAERMPVAIRICASRAASCCRRTRRPCIRVWSAPRYSRHWSRRRSWTGPFRAFAEFPAERPAFIPFERAPPFPAPPYSRGTPARP